MSRRQWRGSLPHAGAVVVLAVVSLLVIACGNGDPTTASSVDNETSTPGSNERSVSTVDSTEVSTTTESTSPSTSPADESLEGRFAYFPALHTMTAFVAEEAGFWDDLNLDVELIRVDSAAIQFDMLASGEAEWANAGLDVVAQFQDQGVPLVHLFPVIENLSLNLVVSNDTLERLEIAPDAPLEDKFRALTEMTIGYTREGAPTETFSRFYLSQGGIDPDTEGDLVAIGGPEAMIEALTNGDIDAFMLSPPTPNQVELEGLGQIFIDALSGEVPELADYPYTGFSANQTYLEDPANHEATVRMVAGLLQAADLIREDPDQALEYLAVYFPDLDRQVLQAGFEDLVPTMPDEPILDEPTVQHLIDVVTEEELMVFQEAPSAAEGVLWTNTYVEEARRLLESSGG